jgi:hypothetical protein
MQENEKSRPAGKGSLKDVGKMIKFQENNLSVKSVGKSNEKSESKNVEKKI